MDGKLSTGVPALDRRLGGGLHPGDVLTVVSSPDTQVQPLLYRLMTERPTLYVSTMRPEAAVQRELDGPAGAMAPVRVEAVGHEFSMDGELLKELTGSRTYAANSAVVDDPLDELYELLDEVDDRTNVVLDPANPVENGADREAYTAFLTEFSRRLAATGGLGVLSCQTLDDPPPFRDATLMVADVVWKVGVTTTPNGDLNYTLRVPKNRNAAPLREELTVEMGHREVHIDESRAI